MDPQRRPAWASFSNAECAVAAHSRPTLKLMKPILVRAAKTATIAALLAGLVFGGLMFYVAGVHNPQQEFHGAEWSSSSSWVFVFATWFAAGFVAMFLSVFVVVCASLKLRSRKDAA